jgi:aminobenzoyl-glutamate transport protein
VSQTSQEPRTLLQTFLDGVETVGNKVPHPAVIFLVLMGVVVLLSHVFYLLDTSGPYQRINPQNHDIEDPTQVVSAGNLVLERNYEAEALQVDGGWCLAI